MASAYEELLRAQRSGISYGGNFGPNPWSPPQQAAPTPAPAAAPPPTMLPPAPSAPVATPAAQGLQQAIVEQHAPGVGWDDVPGVGSYAEGLGSRVPPQVLSGLADVVRKFGRAY